MGFDEIIGGLNSACLNEFGKTLTFIRADTGESLSISGILLEGAEPEEAAPGDGSIWCKAFVATSEISPPPKSGDEIASSSTVYKILEPVKDPAGNGLWLLLRRDREVP